MVASRIKTPKAVLDFLATGKTGGRQLSELVAMCDQQVRALTQQSAANSISLAEQFVRRGRILGGEPLLIALRAAGWAYLVAGVYRKSLGAYLSARKMAQAQPLIRARIDRTLIDVYMYLGKTAEALRCASRAQKAFRKLGADDDLARTDVNLANVLHRRDRHREAFRLYHRAAQHFMRRGDDLSTALCWYNEANTLVQLFEFDKAFDLYSRAREIFRQKEHSLHAYGCLYGLAWLHMLKGDFHFALSELAECEEYYLAGDHKRETILCQLDRAESYLGLNLLEEARRAAQEALIGARKLGIRYEEAKAAFFIARAASALNRKPEARRQLGRAEKLMRCEHNAGFVGAIVVSQALLGNSSRARRNLIDKARRQLRAAQLPLWEAICDVEIALQQPVDKSALLRLDKNQAIKAVPHLLAQYETLQGDYAASKNQTSRAIQRWSRAAEVLDAVKSKLPPIELRSAFARAGRDPFRKIIQAESRRDPRSAAIWVERSKTIGIWSAKDAGLADNPTRQKVQKSMIELSQHVAVLAGVSSGSGQRSAGAGYQTPTFNRLREQVRRDLSTLYAENESREYSTENISQLVETISEQFPIIQFHIGDTDLQAYVSFRGQCRVHTYENGVKELDNLVARWRFFVECAPTTITTHRAADLADEATLLKKLSEWLIDPLTIPANSERLLIIPEGRLYCIPWLALEYENEQLYRRYRVVLSPSVRHFALSQHRKVDSNRACIFVGSSLGLPWLSDEVALVKKRLAGLATEVYSPCRREDWPESSSARIWHFAGHALLRSDNPFYSALLLDKEQIFAADFRLKKNNVDVVTLAACRTGQQTGLAGEEGGGLVRSLLEMGARSVVAGGWAVADHSTALWMDSFYANLMKGLLPAEAMTCAIEAVRSKFPSAYHWAAFSIYGTG